VDILEALDQLSNSGINKDDMELIHSVIAQCRAKIECTDSYLLRNVPDNIEVVFDIRGTVAGYAVGKNKIRLNPGLFKRNREEFLKRTVPHEYAHIVVHNYYPEFKHHGWEWQNVMKILGADVTRCHNYDVEDFRIKKQRNWIEMSCACRKHNISSVIYNRIKKGRKYICKKCRNPLSAN